MMSYLWILLLGSLLASSAKAQDDGAPAEEAATDSETQAPKLDPTPEANGEPDTEKETTAFEIPPEWSEPEATAKPEAGANATVTPADDNEEPTTPTGGDAEIVAPADDNEEATTPTGGDAEVVAPADNNEEPTTPTGSDAEAADDNEEPTTPTGGDAEVVTPADDNEEPTTPTGGDAEVVAPADDNEEPTTPTGGDAEVVAPADDNEESTTPASAVKEPLNPASDDAKPVTPAGDGAEPTSPAEDDEELLAPAPDKEAEATATTQVPVAHPEVGNPEVEQTTTNVKEEEPTVSADVKPAQEESGPDDEINPAGEENKEEPTDAATKQIWTVFNEKAHAPLPSNQGPETVARKNEENEPDINEDLDFNLEDAVSESNPHHSGKGRMSEPDAHVAGTKGDAEKPQAQASSGSLAGIVSAIGVAAVGAVAGYFTYQKKKLCFKNRQEADPEAARKADAAEAQSDPQVLSNLLNSS